MACSRWGFRDDTGVWSEGFDKSALVAQDAWIFRTPLQWKDANLDFHLGCPGCDNVLASVMQRAGYRVINPTAPGPKSLRLHHEHRSQKHNYGVPIRGDMFHVPPVQLG